MPVKMFFFSVYDNENKAQVLFEINLSKIFNLILAISESFEEF